MIESFGFQPSLLLPNQRKTANNMGHANCETDFHLIAWVGKKLFTVFDLHGALTPLKLCYGTEHACYPEAGKVQL